MFCKAFFAENKLTGMHFKGSYHRTIIRLLASRNSSSPIFLIFLDLQFALAYQTASADTEAELRSLITGLHVESDSSKELVLSLQAELEKSQQKVIELEEQLRWQELEKQNQLNIKEAKIQELIRGLNISSSDQKVLIKYYIGSC